MPDKDPNRVVVFAGPRQPVELLAGELQGNRLKALPRDTRSFRNPSALWREREAFVLPNLARAAGLTTRGRRLRSESSLLSWRLESENGALRLEYSFWSQNSLAELTRLCRSLVLNRPEIGCVCAALNSKTFVVRSALVTVDSRDTFITPRSAVQKAKRRQARRWGDDPETDSIGRWFAAHELSELAAGRWDSELLKLQPPVSHFWDF